MPFAQSKPASGALPDPITQQVTIAPPSSDPAPQISLRLKPAGTDSYGLVLDPTGSGTASDMIVFPQNGDPDNDDALFRVSPTGAVQATSVYASSPDGNATALSADVSTGTPSLGFYSAVPVGKQTGVAVTAAAIHAALVNLGLISA